MRAVIQKVKKASVESGGKIVGKIKKGFLVLLAIHIDDTEEKIRKMAEKIVKLRIFEDENEKMNKSLKDVNGEILVVSQFTLYGDCKKGNRPSFIESAKPDKALDYYEKFIKYLEKSDLKVEKGKFRNMMEVSLVNDGPTTLIVDL